MKEYDSFVKGRGNKSLYHSRGKKLLKALAEKCELEGDLRSNKGGVAVMGEVTLHCDTIYIQICELFGNISFLVRQCNGRKDYTGKANHFHTLRKDPVEDLIRLINRLK